MVKVTKQAGAKKKKKTVKKKSPKSSAVGRISALTPVDDAGIKLNVYGQSGSGKTTFWSSFPGPILAIVCSGGARPGELLSVNTPANRKKIDTVVLEKSIELVEVAEHCEHAQYNAVVLEHASGLQDLVLKDLLNLDDIPEQLSWGLATQQQWGQVALQMKQLLRKLLDLSCNVVIVAQEREFSAPDDSSLLMPYVGSALTPSVTGWLNPACDYICQTFKRQKTITKTVKVGKKNIKSQVPVEGVEYCLRTGPHAVFTTKMRTPKSHQPPDLLVDPTYEKLISAIKGK